MAGENPILAAAASLSKILDEEIENLQKFEELDNFALRSKTLTSMSKAVQSFHELVKQYQLDPKEDDGTIESDDDFRAKLAQTIGNLVETGSRETQQTDLSTNKD